MYFLEKLEVILEDLARFYFKLKIIESISIKRKGGREWVAYLEQSQKHLSGNLNDRREQDWHMSGCRAFLAEGTASAKAWRQEWAFETARRLMGLERNESELVVRAEVRRRIGGKILKDPIGH